jgi:hypothetical protein
MVSMLKRRNEIVVKACDFAKLWSKVDTDEELYLLGYNAYSMLKVNQKFGGICHLCCCLLHTGFLFALFINPEDGSDMFILNIGLLSVDFVALWPL